jgi:hypothetical protein
LSAAALGSLGGRRQATLLTSDYAYRQTTHAGAAPASCLARGDPTVAKSKVRKKAVYTPPQRSQKVQVSPRWLVPTMVGAWLLGLAWIATYYVTASTSTDVPVLTPLGNWNLAIGFGMIIVGVVLSTKWR